MKKNCFLKKLQIGVFKKSLRSIQTHIKKSNQSHMKTAVNFKMRMYIHIMKLILVVKTFYLLIARACNKINSCISKVKTKIVTHLLIIITFVLFLY